MCVVSCVCVCCVSMCCNKLCVLVCALCRVLDRQTTSNVWYHEQRDVYGVLCVLCCVLCAVCVCVVVLCCVVL